MDVTQEEGIKDIPIHYQYHIIKQLTVSQPKPTLSQII